MPFIRRHWTALEADEWTREDWLVIVISPIIYVLLTVGLALTVALKWSGYIMLAVGIVLTVFMHWVIDPKLKAVSEEYEKKQQEYLKELEAKARWQES